MTMQTEETPRVRKPPARVRRTGPYKAADARREAILDAAIEHFALWGYFNSSVPKIAADVGVTKAGLIHHFASKEVLLSAVLELREQRAVTAFYSGEGSQNPSHYFGQIAVQAAFNESQPGLTQMFSVLAAEASNPEHPAHEYFVQRYERITEAIADILTEMVVAGTLLPETDVHQIAREILAVVDGFTVQWALATSTFSLHDSVRSYLDRLLRTITPGGRGLPDPPEVKEVP
jgi:AcrR family transcriptional regulator